MAARNIHRPGHRGLRGYYPSKKAGRTVAFESRLERDHLLLLDADPDVRSFDEQPVTIHFDHADGRRRYTPDVRVLHRDGTTTFVEVKYESDIAAMTDQERTRMREAHRAASDWCRANGSRFSLRTDHDIVGPALDRARALHAYARARGGTDVVRRLVAERPGLSLRELTSSVSPNVRSVALHLLWLCELRDEPFAVPSDETRLFLVESAR